MNRAVDTYLQEGCGRCDHYRTPQCKVHIWNELLVALRQIILQTELTEEYKWSQPCYTFHGKNVMILTAFKHHACLSFFKGSLLPDPDGLLTRPGASSQAAMQMRFTDVDSILDKEANIRSYIEKAIELEKQGARVAFKKQPEDRPEELTDALETDNEFQNAFEALTPGRQRGYILHFSQAKRPETRRARIAKWRDSILRGEGMHDAYRKGKK
ncbi:MAG: hypothetical protein HKN79_03555 [Flavobacteriales bacterium]|nr:hypothetical protein [Flavobacteriales bacterium]